MDKFIFILMVIFVGMGSELGVAQESGASEQRDQIFDDTPVRHKIADPTPTPAYKSFQDQGMNKREMLEEVDKHLTTITSTLSQLNDRLFKIEETIKKIPREIDQIKNTELPAIKKQLSTSLYAASVSASNGSGTGSGSNATLGKVLEGIGNGELKDMKAKVEEMHVTSVPNLQFEISVLKDTVRTLEAMISNMDTLKVKGQGGASIELDKGKKIAP